MPTKIYKKRIQNKEMYLLNKKKKLPIINKTCDKIKSPKKIKAKVVFPFHGHIEKWTYLVCFDNLFTWRGNISINIEYTVLLLVVEYYFD
jgi:hypothetical protein